MGIFKKNKRKFVAALNDVQKADVTNMLNRLKHLEQERIGTSAVLESTIRNAGVAAGIRDFGRVAFDLDRMTFYEVPVAEPPKGQPEAPQKQG